MGETVSSTPPQDDVWARAQRTAMSRELIRAERGNVGQLLALLALVISLQIYTLALTSVMKTVESLGRELQTTEEELRQLAAANAGDQSVVRQATYARFGTLQRSYQASQLILVRLATPWQWMFAPNADELKRTVAEDPDGEAMRAAIRERSSDQGGRVMLQALALYLLPLLYGMLGASAFVLRALGQSVQPAAGALEHFRLRLALGALLGGTAGLFFSADTPIAGTTLSLVAIAFLAGYSAEFFFAVFDFMIGKVRDTLQPGEAAKSEATARASMPGAAAAAPAA
jgi:hypothetical protein